MSLGHMVVHGAGVVCAHGTPSLLHLLLFICPVLTLILVVSRIVRAFLIEEAKVVKRVIKSQQKATSGRS
jgi:hypothetical protein